MQLRMEIKVVTLPEICNQNKALFCKRRVCDFFFGTGGVYYGFIYFSLKLAYITILSPPLAL